MKTRVLFVLLCCTLSCCKKSNTLPATTTTTPTPTDTAFTGVPDVKDIVMYEVNIRAFSAADDFAGVEERLDSIKALGVNVIWLMPTYPEGVDNSPYCVQNYRLVNPEFGTLGDLQGFVSMAHAKGMAVILDWVTDGTSFNSIWISLGNTSWYITNSAGQIQPLAAYNDIAALNYTNAAMRVALIQDMEYWIQTANVDGFRCDNADNDPESFWTQAIDSLNKLNRKLVLLAESNNTNKFGSGFQMDYGWNYFNALTSVFGSNASAATLGSVNASENAGTPPGTYMLRMTTNHDLDRQNGTPIQLFNGIQGSLAAYVLAATMGGVPLIYDGQEVGCNVSLNIFNTSTVIDWTANNGMSGAYEQIIAFRNAHDAIKEGNITLYGNADVAVYERTTASDTALILVNVRNTTETYTLDAPIRNTTWYDALNNKAALSLGTSVSLAPYGYMLLSRQQ